MNISKTGDVQAIIPQPWVSVILGNSIIILAVKSCLESRSHNVWNSTRTCLFISLLVSIPLGHTGSLWVECSLSSYSVLCMALAVSEAEGFTNLCYLHSGSVDI